MLLKRLRQGVLFSAMTLAAAAPVSAVASENDPWEGYNRAMFSFNETVDKYTLKPVAQGYRFIMPDIAETGVSNFFGNIGDIRSAVNSALQGKGDDALTSVARIVFNSTFGIAGLIDVATPMGLEKQREGFGQTLAVWGMDSGPYVVLPFLGSSTVRDTIGLVPDWYLTPVTYVDDVPTRNTLYGLALIDARAQLLQAEQIVSGDKYIFVRDAYLQRREYLIHDGNIPVQYDDNDF